jgi:large subunit ribosomal protein L29
MKIQEVRQQTLEELQHKEEDLQRELFSARIKRFTDNAPDTARVGRLKKDIARVKTVLREVELGINESQSPAKSEEE